MVYTEVLTPDFVSESVVELYETTDDWALLIQQAPYNKHPHLIQMPFSPNAKTTQNQIKSYFLLLCFCDGRKAM